MTFKAFISKMGSDRSANIVEQEIDTASKFGFEVESETPEGILTKGSKDESLKKDRVERLEKEGFRVKILPDTNVLKIGSFTIDTEKEPPELPPNLKIPESLSKVWSHYLIQLKEPPRGDLITYMEDKGVDVVEPVSSYAVFVNGKQENVENLKNLNFVEKVLPFEPAYRIDKTLLEMKGNIKYVNIGVYPPTDINRVKEKVKQVNGIIVNETKPTEGYQGEYATLLVEVDSANIDVLACLPSIRWLEYASPTPELDGERESQIIAHNLTQSMPIPGYDNWITKLGLSGEGVIIAICDTGIDRNLDNNANGHPDLRGRQVAFVDYTKGKKKTDEDGHGTHVAGICVGNPITGLKEGPPPGHFLWGQGIAPKAQYVNQNAVNPKATRWPPPDWAIFTKDAVSYGAHIMNNSWRDGNNSTGYSANERRFDQLSRDPTESSPQKNLVIVFSAGNGGPNYETITSPHEAKNPIVVGCSWTYRPKDYNDIRGLYERSSRGPAHDGRILPNIVAPGTYVSSTWPTTPNPPSSKYPFVPNVGKKYRFGTGTSMAASQVSGCCALLIEWWKKRTKGRTPSLAFLKALLINSAEDIEGGHCGRLDGNNHPIPIEHIPNNDQGWGLVNLRAIFEMIPDNSKESKIFSDQNNPFTSREGDHSIQVTPVDVSKELRITLAWTDPPGAQGANPALVNDLDLMVTEVETGNIYKGNVFAEGHSITGGEFDNKNNIECVYIKQPGGIYEVHIISFGISANARPPFDNTIWQDYALVIDNAVPVDGTAEGIILD